MEEADESNFKPRPYQDQILSVVLKNNSIVYLPTGSGKTFIAIMAIKHYSSDLQCSVKNGGKRTVFLCNTVALAKQQAVVLQRALNLKCVVYTGDMNVDNWKREKWEGEFETNQVIVATVQIVVDVVRHGFIKITDFNLMVFDECHHAANNHPMFQLLNQFQYYPPSQHPRVLGLTGILTRFCSKHKFIRDLEDLEARFRGKIVTALNIEEFKNILIYSTKPKEIIIKYYESSALSPIKQKIEMLVSVCQENSKTLIVDDEKQEDIKKPLKNIIKLWNDFIYQMHDMGLYAASIAIMSLLVEMETKKRAAESISQRNVYRLSICYAERIRHLLVEEIYDPDDDNETEEDVILDHSTSKLQAFISYMKQEFATKLSTDIKCLVFVQRRRTAKCLYHIIKRFSSCTNNFPITPEFMVGANSGMPESIESILEQKWDKNILNSFKKNECNLIVSTSVLEEGIDIQSCNYVIIFDDLKCFTSYLQTKGRARMNESIYAIMVSELKKTKILEKINEYKEADIMLKEYLVGKTVDRSIPTYEQISEQFQDVIKPFHSNIGARLEAHSAIQLLNRYCMTLPNDNFTLSKIDWELVEVKSNYTAKCQYIVKINMPLQSTIKETIVSDVMSSPHWAKKSAAFKACVQLYHNKEFGENLLPISKRNLEEKVELAYFKHWENFPEDNAAVAGTTKMKRMHKIQYPSQIISALPKPNSTAYIYVIKLTPEFSRNEENEHVLDLLNSSSFYAILTSKPLPKLAAMPLFMTQGMVIADIVSTPITTNIPSDDHLKLLRNFHVMLFRDILRTWKTFLANDYRNEENSFLIVPTKNGKDIDWELVKNFQNLNPNREKSRSNVNYIPSDFENRVVCTRYSVDDTTRYVVRKIRNDLTPFSPFPNSTYESFAHYVHDKYKENVNNRNQFLIEVKPITSRVNFLTSGAGEAGSRKKIKKLDDILLIPELCYNFRYPGDMWLKAVFIPSVLHRLHYLLLAEELRVSILSFLKLEYPNYVPEQVIVDKHLKRVNKFDSKEEIKAPVFPNPENTVSRQVDNNNRFVEATNKWKSYEEPCDLTRNLDNLFKVELDYYHQFITMQLANLDVNDKSDDNNELSFIGSENVSAICDIPDEDKLKIDILEIPNVPTKSPEQWEFLCALTASSTGDVFDMERYELLGDSFLKFSISLYLLHKHPKWHEGFLSSIKGKFVSNQNLLYCAIKNNIPGRINISTFNAKAEWQPPLIAVPQNAVELVLTNNASPTVLWELVLNSNEIETGKCDNETLNELYTHFSGKPTPIESSLNTFTGYQVMADKVSADCMEALLGVCLKNFGIAKTFSLLELFNISPPNENLSNLLNLNLGDPRVKTDITIKEVDAFLTNYQDLEKKLGYTFRNRAYLLQALTHPSFPTNRLTGCYQQLEFLGDAVLDFLISCYIFEKCQDMDPGKLTDLRSAIVNNVTLACITVRNKFHLFLLSQNSKLLQSIANFYNFQQENNFEVNDQVRLLIQENETSQCIADYIDVPKALGDIFESLIGAVYLDSGNNINVTWKVIYGLLSNEIESFIRRVPLQVVRQLYEYKGAGPVFSDPIVDELDEEHVLVKCKFTCRNEIREVCGFGHNKEQAKIAAAKLALQCLYQA